MKNALLEELTQPTNLALAFNIAGDAIGLPPMINSIIINAVTGVVEGFNENPEERILGMFKGMFKNFINTSVKALTFGTYDPVKGGWDKNWNKEYHFMQLVDFIDIVEEKGIAAALENYAAGIFRDEAIRAINEVGGIRDFLTGKAGMVKESNVWLKKINITNEDKLYLDPNTNDIIGRDYGNIKERGKYGVNPITGGFGLITGTLEEATENGTRMVYYVTDSTIIEKMEVYGTSGGHIQIIAKDKEAGLQLNEDGIPLGGIVADFEKGKLYEYEYLGNAINFELNFDDPKVNIQEIGSFDFSSLTNEEKEDLLTYYFIINGLNNPNSEGIPPETTAKFKEELSRQGLDPNNIFLVPIYERGTFFTDAITWLRDEFLQKDVIADELYQKYTDYLDALSPEARARAQKVSVLYSGSFNPWLRAVEKYDINVETIVAYGGPSLRGTVLRKTIFDDRINNSHVKNFINIYGENDHYGKVLLVQEKKFSNVDVINIKLKGADHYDFSLNPNKTGSEAEINRKAAQFNAYATKIASNIDDFMIDVLQQDGVTPVYVDGKVVEYEIDLDKFKIPRKQ